MLSEHPARGKLDRPCPTAARSNKSNGWSSEPARGPVEQGNPTSARTERSDEWVRSPVEQLYTTRARTGLSELLSDVARGREESNSSGGGISFLKDIPRMNVALTQAKSSMFIMGNRLILSQDPTWKALVEDAAGRSATSESNVLLHVLNPHRFQTSTIYPIDVFQQSINSKPPVGLLMTPKQASEQSQARGTVTRANQALKRKISIDASDGVQDRRDKAAGPSTIRGSHPVNPQQILGITPAVIPLPKEAAGQSCPGPSAPENFWYVLSAR
ncbi:hypothetical protein PSTG_14013 [Puccinia striiformis f. sp. tritici PST-78]|uniref:DNA2/NAM7 helicase-like C-terminal domain-containing protein n=1 Tax=Puccinia striiformis f. sp. tritici PST-78 TaxID=1165861 RepID=A0A0L0V0Q1_9BASI|nr:hypothetical protein PSTG_14013 [Puccinia striiformis f. sp. tritici PST-78]